MTQEEALAISDSNVHLIDGQLGTVFEAIKAAAQKGETFTYFRVQFHGVVNTTSHHDRLRALGFRVEWCDTSHEGMNWKAFWNRQ